MIHAYSLGPERIEDGMEMVRIGGGLTAEEFDASPHMFTNTIHRQRLADA